MIEKNLVILTSNSVTLRVKGGESPNEDRVCKKELVLDSHCQTLATSPGDLLGDGLSGTTFFHSFGSSGVGSPGNRKANTTHQRVRVVQSVFFAEIDFRQLRLG